MLSSNKPVKRKTEVLSGRNAAVLSAKVPSFEDTIQLTSYTYIYIYKWIDILRSLDARPLTETNPESVGFQATLQSQGLRNNSPAMSKLNCLSYPYLADISLGRTKDPFLLKYKEYHTPQKYKGSLALIQLSETIILATWPSMPDQGTFTVFWKSCVACPKVP